MGFSHHCPHLPHCPGCRIEKGEPQGLQEVRHFFEKWNLRVPYVKGLSTEWRSRSKLAVRKSEGGFKLGLFMEDSHDVVEIPHCKMHTKAINQALKVCREALRKEKGLSFYDEKANVGALRYLIFSEESLSSKVAVVFVLNLSQKGSEVEVWKDLSLKLMKKHPELFHSFWLNFHQESSNAVKGQEYLRVVGEKYQWERVENVMLPFHPMHFRQANLPLFQRLLGDMKRHIPNKKRIVDLFGGMGAIGFTLCSEAKSVHCVEIDKMAEESFEEAKKRLPFPIQKRVSFHHLSCDSNEIESLLDKAETIIVDPPRKGLSDNLMDQISKSPASTLVYISCNHESLLSNLSYLFTKKWKPIFAKAYQFFPRTAHIESLVMVSRQEL